MTSNGDWWANSITSTNYIHKENSIENESILKNLIEYYNINEFDSFFDKKKTNSESGFSYEK